MFDQEPKCNILRDSDYYDRETRVDPPMPPPNKAKRITIEPLDRGFVVQVGCQTFAFIDLAELMKNLHKYLEDPNKVERAWFNGELF